LIQKHDARRLHYDFRLELDGVLLSWAVTKGPSLDPSDKRLAVRTEDHPLEYGGFEGTIPKGEYGGGTVMLWDRGTWNPEGDPRTGLERGRLSFTLQGERLNGAWSLVRMQGDAGKHENWLLIKKKDQEARPGGHGGDLLARLTTSVKTRRTMEQIASGKAPARERVAKPAASKVSRASRIHGIQTLIRRYSQVQLATLVKTPPEGEEWLHEIKFDGFRLLGFTSNHIARLRTRNGQDWTDRFPTIQAALESLPVDDAVLDMEAVAMDAHGKSDFQGLQAGYSDRGSYQVVGCVFDLLHLNHADLRPLPLVERKEKLRLLLEESSQESLRYSAHAIGQGGRLLAEACKRGLEGLISKRIDDPYVAGREKSWLKTKCLQRQEFIIVGYSDPRQGERAIGALYLGYRKGNRLHYAGKVGTGFTMQSARGLARRLEGISVRNATIERDAMAHMTSGEWEGIHWVEPVLVCEVAFTEWTRGDRVRHPSFIGLRADKDAADVAQEKATSPPAGTKARAGNGARSNAAKRSNK
jgi:bifunctional non-homologous end joining protein LigD